VIRILLIAVLMFVIARAFWQVVDGIMEAAGAGGSHQARRRRRRGPPAVAVKLARDPVCGTHVPVNAALSLTANGETRYFCSEQCRDTFQRRA
jgi:YHS domain-containing protein